MVPGMQTVSKGTREGAFAYVLGKREADALLSRFQYAYVVWPCIVLREKGLPLTNGSL